MILMHLTESKRSWLRRTSIISNTLLSNKYIQLYNLNEKHQPDAVK